jgi:hypothetical protein
MRGLRGYLAIIPYNRLDRGKVVHNRFVVRQLEAHHTAPQDAPAILGVRPGSERE